MDSGEPEDFAVASREPWSAAEAALRATGPAMIHGRGSRCMGGRRRAPRQRERSMATTALDNPKADDFPTIEPIHRPPRPESSLHRVLVSNSIRLPSFRCS